MQILKILILTISIVLKSEVQAAKNCSHPLANANVQVNYPANSKSKPPFRDRSIFTFQCALGYQAVRGDESAICLDGKWKRIENGKKRNYEPLFCQEKPCPAVAPGNGSVRVHKKNVFYLCNRGFILKGTMQSQCLLNKTGEYYILHQRPQCEESLECEKPEVEGLVYNGDCCYARDRLTLSCKEDYRLQGPTALTCLPSGKWNDTIPRCKWINRCGKPKESPHSDRKGKCCEVGSHVTYTCHEGYELVDASLGNSMTCLPSENWNIPQPRCKPINQILCPDIPLKENNLTIRKAKLAQSNMYLISDEVKLACIKNYATEASYMTLMCNESGAWDEEIPKCRPLEPCQRPSPIVNGKILELVNNAQTIFPVNYELNIECNENYEIKTAIYHSRCLGDNKWENEVPNCTLIECSNPGIPKGGMRNGGDFHIGRNVTYSCNAGLKLLGSETRTCLITRRWSGTTTVCDDGDTDCPDPGVPTNSQRSGNDFSVSQKVIYTCARKHYLIGNRTRYCLEDGKWSGEEIICLGPNEYSDANTVAAELEGTITEVSRMSPHSNSMDILARSGAVETEGMNGVNIYFIFDVSGSISEVHFEQMKELARIIIRKIGISSSPRGVRAGAIKFSKTAEKVLLPSIDKTTDKALEKINAMNKTEKGTNIVAALNELLKMMATAQESDGRRNSKNYAFLISDGRINEGGKPNKEADQLYKRYGVEMYAISVGANEDRDVLLTVTGNKQDRIFKFSDHKKVFDLFSKIIDNKIDFSPCGSDRPKLTFEKFTQLPDQEKKAAKGKSRSKRYARIVGGKESKFSWPWMAAIYKLNSDTNQFKFQCGGSIIHHYWILSAAHCYIVKDIKDKDIIDPQKTKNNLKESNWKIYLGRTDLTDITTAVPYNVKEIIYHPDYAPQNLANDVALIKTRGPIQYDIFTRPICLPPIFQGEIKQASLYEAGKTVTVIGWGHTEAYESDNMPSDVQLTKTLKELTIPLQPTETCKETVKGYMCIEKKNCLYAQIKPAVASLCAGTGLGGQDACRGDSGGPLMQLTKSNSSGLVERRWYQVGIVSWGPGCGMKDKYGYYSHVARLRNWIVNKTGVEFEEVVPLEE